MSGLLKREYKLPMNKSDLSRNAYALSGALSKKGYMRWWHSFTGIQPETGEERVFFIEYFIINPALGREKPVLGQLPYNKKRGIKPSYVMIKAGAFGNEYGAEARQFHAFYPPDSLKMVQEPLVMKIDMNFYSENHIYGSVEVSREEARRKSFMCQEGSMDWNLEVHKTCACHTGFLASPFFSRLNTMNTYWHGEGIQTYYRGTVSLDGVVYKVTTDSSYGYADKHWGRSFNSPWLQFASCRLISGQTSRELKHSALAITGCCPKFLWFPLKRRIFLQFTYEGEDYTFRLSGLRPFSRAKWEVKETNNRVIWRFAAADKKLLLKISGACLKEEMLAMNYEAPDGYKPSKPLLEGGSGTGKILVYRLDRGEKELVDTLTMENIFCAYGS